MLLSKSPKRCGMEKKVTMADIAKRMGVSTVTISKALAGKDGVSEETRRKIQKLALEMGYRVKTSANSDMSGETVGILIPERFISKDQSSFYLTLYERVLASLRCYNMFGVLETVLWEEEGNLTIPRMIQNGRVQALILIGSLSTSYLRFIQNQGLPVVHLDAYDAQISMDTVISDGYYGMYRMTNYLIQHGHRQIAYLGRVGATSSITDRYFGYCRALQEAGIPMSQDWVIPDRDEHGYYTIDLPAKMPSAFVCNCDAVAYNLIRLLDEKGCRVPEDISVVAYDDFLFSELASPKITTYAVDMDGMARASVAQLRERWERPDKESAFRVVTGFLREKGSVRTKE